ncbi:transcription factor, partial [Haematococcus lacustris]
VQTCTFFVRTGTCAYGDRCKFLHPTDCPPPQLNSAGYPIRTTDPICAHYLKKGWCAFGITCKFHVSHPGHTHTQQFLSAAYC